MNTERIFHINLLANQYIFYFFIDNNKLLFVSLNTRIYQEGCGTSENKIYQLGPYARGLDLRKHTNL